MKKLQIDFFTNLPQEIIIEILTRLPIASIKSCKRVCKSWRDLVELPEFATSHLSKATSTSCLAFVRKDHSSSKASYKVCAVLPSLDGLYGAFSSLAFLDGIENAAPPHSSANGLLFFLLLDRNRIPRMFICNPITREYTERPGPHPLSHPDSNPHLHPHPRRGPLIYGFGASNITRQYKIVELSTKLEGFIYTLGTGLWRSIGACNTRFGCREDEEGVFLNGNLHWLVYDSEYINHPWMSCLDLENEVFTSLSPLPRVDSRPQYSLCALGGRLCFSDSSPFDEVAIWFMNKYGDEKSWAKELIIKKPRDQYFYYGLFRPVEVFKDGDILLVNSLSLRQLFCYSNKNKTIEIYDYRMSCGSDRAKVVAYTPSFVSLKSLGMVDVHSF